jgi:hypothetical protein
LALGYFKVTLAHFGQVLTKTNILGVDFVERFIVDDGGRGKLELALKCFKVTLARFGEALTKSTTLSADFVERFIVDDGGRVRLAIGCAHFGLTLNQIGVLLVRSNFKSEFFLKYIMDNSKWCVVKRLDKFSCADVDASLANAQTPATGRLVNLSNMQHPDRPEWELLSKELDILCLDWWQTKLSGTDKEIEENISNTTIKLLLEVDIHGQPFYS